MSVMGVKVSKCQSVKLIINWKIKKIKEIKETKTTVALSGSCGEVKFKSLLT